MWGDCLEDDWEKTLKCEGEGTVILWTAKFPPLPSWNFIVDTIENWGNSN